MTVSRAGPRINHRRLAVLGLVIEQVTGKSLPGVITSQILKPLQMSSTSFPTAASFPSPHPRGYTHDLNLISGRMPTSEWADATDWDPSVGWAAGSMVSRVGDLLTWCRGACHRHKTVRNYVSSIFHKIGATSRVHAVVRARKADLS